MKDENDKMKKYPVRPNLGLTGHYFSFSLQEWQKQIAKRKYRMAKSEKLMAKAGGHATPLALFLEELLWASGVEIAEIGRVDDTDMRAEGALGTIEEEVAVGRGWRCRQVCDEITAETVATPHAEFRTQVVGKRLLVGAGTRHGQDTRYTDQRRNDDLGETRFCKDKHLTIMPLLLHLTDGLPQ